MTARASAASGDQDAPRSPRATPWTPSPFIAPSDRIVLGSPSNYHWRTWPLP